MIVKYREIYRGELIMKPSKIIGFVLGCALVFLAVGAYFSDEPASKTDSGKIAMLFAALMGASIIIGNLSANPKATTKLPIEKSESITNQALLCTACGKQISSDYRVCPYCSHQLKRKCSSCGRDVEGDFVVCPYCATSLN
jgi:DNA-directed RNA polymerase subunit RPC12/RpoP